MNLAAIAFVGSTLLWIGVMLLSLLEHRSLLRKARMEAETAKWVAKTERALLPVRPAWSGLIWGLRITATCPECGANCHIYDPFESPISYDRAISDAIHFAAICHKSDGCRAKRP